MALGKVSVMLARGNERRKKGEMEILEKSGWMLMDRAR